MAMTMREFMQRSLLVVGGYLFLLVALHHHFSQNDDPHRCRALLETGRWIDRADEHGHRAPFEQWQPDGCILHNYTVEDAEDCLGGRRVVTNGDDMVRQVAWSFGRLFGQVNSSDAPDNTQLTDFNITHQDIDIDVQHHWNPYQKLNGSAAFLQFRHDLDLMRLDREEEIPATERHCPSMMTIGAGTWLARPEHNKTMMVDYPYMIHNISHMVGNMTDFITGKMDPVEGAGDQLVFVPPFGPYYTGPGGSKHHRWAVKKLQKWLHDNQEDIKFPIAWAFHRAIKHQPKVWSRPEINGYVTNTQVNNMKLNVLLNLRCNAKLDRLRGFPYSRTCCTDYGIKSPVQRTLVALAWVFLSACLLASTADLYARRDMPRWHWLNMNVGTFAVALLAAYSADRTHLLAKASKLWSYHDFFILLTLVIFVTLATIRELAAPSKPTKASGQQDETFLSRSQTEEWKGWMQALLLVCHWTGGPPTSNNVFMRLLAAAYLFQTGYGHATYFLTKKDFSFHRVASVLLRLNILSCSLSFVMNTSYVNYYFAPLVSFWFLVIFTTLAIRHETLNGNMLWVLAKTVASAFIMSVIIFATPLMRWFLTALHWAFKMKIDADEWNHVLSTDFLIVYIGMLAAIARMNVKAEITFNLRIGAAVVGTLLTGLYLGYYGQLSSDEYSHVHPYLSFVPILGYIGLRNVSHAVRAHHSAGMAWLGRCSLELYALQFHLLMAADSKGVLLLNGSHGDATLADRWRSLTVIVPVFLLISSRAASATKAIVKVFLAQSQPRRESYALVASDSGPASNEVSDEEFGEEQDIDNNKYARRAMASAHGSSSTRSASGLLGMLLSVMTSLQGRVFLLLAVIWILNLYA